MRKLLLLLLVTATTFFAYASASAQNRVVKGSVFDEQGEPLIGANVVIEGTFIGTVTSITGDFELNVEEPKTSVLVVSYYGYETVKVPASQVDMKIVLKDNLEELDEVVVTALGIKRSAKALGYAMTKIDSDEIVGGRESNMILALSGKVSGVDISAGTAGPSGSIRVVIRGNSQLSGSNIPLYVVDGLPLENTQLGSAGTNGGYDFGDGLSSINPNDIESISVLKGAAASALYGSRGANGVVLITTKKAEKGDGIGVEVSMNYNVVDLANGFDDYQRVYGQGRDGKMITDQNDASSSTQSAWGAKLDPSLKMHIYNGQLKPYSNQNDNVLSFFRTGHTFTNSVALSKRTDVADFRFSISDMRNLDIVPDSDMNRTTFMFNGGANLNDRFRVEVRANYTKEAVNNRPALSDSPNNIGNAIVGLAPNFHQSWLSEGYKDEYGRYVDWNGNIYRMNPYWVLKEMSNESLKDRVMGHVQLNYNFTDKLSFNAKAGTDFYNFKMNIFAPTGTPGDQVGSMSVMNTSVYENNFEGMLRYETSFADIIGLSAFVGGNIMQYNLDRVINAGAGQVIDGVKDITNYTDYTIEHINPRSQMNSLFGSVNLSFKDMLYVDATIRNDVTSTLHSDNRSFLYSSISGSFVFSELLDAEAIGMSFGKLRASYAKVGGATDPYQLALEYGVREFALGGAPLGEISSAAVPSMNIKPTSNYSLEFGLDLRFFQGRLGFDIGYYSTSSKDQIIRLPVSETSGYNYKTINAGEIRNSGIEVAINASPIRSQDFNWNMNLNFSSNVNEVVKLHPDLKNYELASARWAGAYIYATEGEAYGVIKGKAFAHDAQGNMIINKGLPTYEKELSVLGNGNHDFIAGLNNTFSYKNISLGVLFDMKWGGEIYSMTAMNAHTYGISKNTLEGRQEWYESEELRMSQNIDENDESWIPTGGYMAEGVMQDGEDTEGNPKYVKNTVAVNPQDYYRSISENSPEPYIYDASYIKLRELTLSYNIPIKGSKMLESLAITAFARNLWLIYSNTPNIDPESNYNNGNGQGFEYGSLPSRRTFGLGVNLKF